MTLLLFHALLLASAAAAAKALDNATGDGNNSSGNPPVLCNGVGCEPPAQPLPIYGYPPPSLPSAPPTPPSSPGSQKPCPPVAVVCCDGATGGQYVPQQPNTNAPPTGGYVPYYNASAAPPALLAPVTAGCYVMMTVLVAACLMLQLQWIVV